MVHALLAAVAVFAAGSAHPPPGPGGLAARLWSFDWRPRGPEESAGEVRRFRLGSAPVEGAPVRVPEGEFGSVRRSGISWHKGVDYLAPALTPVRAASAGFVCYNELNGTLDTGYGYTVIVDHEDNFYTLYAHLNEPSPLAVGARVAAGEPIGRVGRSGNASRIAKEFQYQLHFEILHAPSGLIDLGGLRVTALLSDSRIIALREVGEAVYGVYWGGAVNPEEIGGAE